MTKSHAEELSDVYESLFEDIAYAYPTLRVELGRDRVRLAAAVKERGIHVLYVDLPNLGKHLDRCLAQGQYSPSGLPLSRAVSPRVQIPKFLRGLYLLIFDGSGAMKGDYDVQAIRMLRQVLYLAKRTAADCSVHATRQEVKQFVDVDGELPSPESFWTREVLTLDDVGSSFGGFATSGRYQQRAEELVSKAFTGKGQATAKTLLSNVDKMSALLVAFLGPYAREEWRHRHGPGAISDPVKHANKYAFNNWSRKLDREFPYSDVAFHDHAAWARRMASGPHVSEEEPWSRLIAVPKSYTKPRLIASEPSEHQFCQQLLRDYMYQRVARTWIGEFVRFRDQTLNQSLCRRGSEDGTLCTVDLSAASDRVSCHFVGQLFRSNPDLLLALQSSRTTQCWIAEDLLPCTPTWALIIKSAVPKAAYGGKPGYLLKLNKFSTMGSACTFPIETLGFLTIALASVLTARGWSVCLRNILRLRGEVAVFGDDIVVPADSRELFLRALEVFDFKVNQQKTYGTGLFRESCGLDAYAGVDVTPVYWRAPNDGSPESIASTIEVSNNFYRLFLLRTAERVARTVQGVYPLVSMQSGVLGLKTFVYSPHLLGPNQRWNKHLQRWEVQVRQILSQQVTTPIQDDTALLQFFTEQPDPGLSWVGGVRQRPSLRKKKRWVAVTDLASSS